METPSFPTATAALQLAAVAAVYDRRQPPASVRRSRLEGTRKSPTVIDRRYSRKLLLPLMALLLTACSAFHPKHEAGSQTAATAKAGDVTVQFAGTTVFSQGDLQDALSNALDEIKTDGLNAATADDAAFFLELYYRKNGYAFVESNYTIDNPKHLTLKVSEGPLVTLGSITFTGNEHYKDPKNFQEYIIGQTRQRFPSSTKVYPYVEADVQKGTELVQRFYLAEGYLNAEVSPPVVNYAADRTRADVTVAIAEGNQYHFDGVEIAGQLIFPPAQVRGLIADQIPLPYTKPRVDDMQRKLQDYYKRHGYYMAVVTATSDPLLADADNRVPTSFLVEPGPLYHFDGIRVTGTDRLHPSFLQARFRKLTGQVYDPDKLDEVYQQMIKTGLFSLLRVDPVVQPDDTLRPGYRRQGSQGAVGWFLAWLRNVRRADRGLRNRQPGFPWNGTTDQFLGRLFDANLKRRTSLPGSLSLRERQSVEGALECIDEQSGFVRQG